MLPSDSPAAASLLQESPEASKWSKESLEESTSQWIAWVAELDGQVVGFLIGRPAADEFEILNLAVGKKFRRKGIANFSRGSRFQCSRDCLVYATGIPRVRAAKELLS
jgi:N-acetylglutamate synthase-like GNAT family acetyltransferase